MSTSSLSTPPPQTPPVAAAPLVEIVADGGPRLGFGHVGRCLALWEELRGRAVFNVADRSVACFLQARGAPVAPARSDHVVRTCDASLAARGDAPAAHGDALVAHSDAPLVLLDRAGPVSVEEVSSLQAAGRRVVLLDDLGPARLLADAVIDPPTAARWPPAAGLRLAGFEHVLLRHEVRAARDHSVARTADADDGVLVAIGGSDPEDLTPAIVLALLAAGIDVTVSLGPGYRGSFSPARSPAAHAEDFVTALAHARLLIGGYGHSLLEAAYLGVPAIAVTYRPEQLPHAQAFCRQGTAEPFDFTSARAAALADSVTRLLAEPAPRARMSARGRELVDGHGARRIAQALAAMT